MIAQSTPSIQPSRQHSYLCSNIDVSWPTFCNHDRNCSYPSQRYFQSPDRFRQYIRSEYTRPGSSCNDVTSPLSDISHGMAAEHRRPTQRPPLFTHHGICFSTYDHRILRTRLPVRSALFKQDTGGLVVRWVTTSESPLLYVFAFLFAFFFARLCRF
jgi:hypothetical protein